LKRVLVNALKVGLPAALFVYLLWRVPASDYQEFFSQPKRWNFLFAAQAIALLASVVTFLRWQQLVRAFAIPFTAREALRLGFVGYLLNFVSFGSVGGDLFKAIIVAKHKPGARPEAVASVLLDRAIGLLGLILLTVISLSLLPAAELTPVMRGIRDTATLLAGGSITALLVAIYSGNWFERILDWMRMWPLVGSPLTRMAHAVRLLRGQPATLLALIVVSVLVHLLLSLTVYLVSCGLYAEQPTLLEHMFVVPPGLAAGALPLAPGGIGTQEFVLEELFKQLPQRPENFSGILVATVYRLITLAIAGVGVIYYWASHSRELREAQVLAERMSRASGDTFDTA
jgi:glycosyltransferase 2 family protein